MGDDPAELAPEEARRLMSLAAVAVLLLAPALLRLAPTATPPPPSTLCVATVDGVCSSESARLLMGTPLDLNRASARELELVPGIGPKLASRIVAARPFNQIADLDRVEGIGPKLRSALAHHVRIAPRTIPSEKSDAAGRDRPLHRTDFSP